MAVLAAALPYITAVTGVLGAVSTVKGLLSSNDQAAAQRRLQAQQQAVQQRLQQQEDTRQATLQGQLAGAQNAIAARRAGRNSLAFAGPSLGLKTQLGA
jgi:hypothetical protein